MWRRHPGDRAWHTGRDGDHSFVTHCRGRWSLTDEAAGDVERNDNPPHEERCDECSRQRIDQIRIEYGLAELADHIGQLRAEVAELDDNPFGFDLGGEA